MPSNSDFLAAAYGALGDGYGWTASFKADPNKADAIAWAGLAWHETPKQREIIDAAADNNNFFSVAVMHSDERRRNKAAFSRLAVLLADDADPHSLENQVSYVLETSAGNYQIGVFLDAEDPDTHDRALIDRVLQHMAAEKLINADASGNNVVRYGRLPVGRNTKAAAGGFETKLHVYEPEYVYSLEEAVAAFGLDLNKIRSEKVPGQTENNLPVNRQAAHDAEAMFKLLLASDPDERSYHEPLLKISSGMIAAGMKPHAVINMLRALGGAIRPESGEQLDRWNHRFGHELERMVQGAEKFAPLPIADGEWLQTAAQLKQRCEDVEWLVKDLVPENSMGMLFGASGTFKSFLCIDLCMHLVHGLEWADRRSKMGAAIYIAAEGGAGISRRIDAWHKKTGCNLPENFWVCTVPVLLNDEDQIAILRSKIAAAPEKPSLIIIDTLSQTFSGEENSSSDISNYLRLINTEIRAAFETTVIVVHHTGHSVADRPRGSSAMVANLDFVLGAFRPDPEAMVAKLGVHKMKDADKVDDLYFNLDRLPLGRDKYGDELSSLVASHHDNAATLRDALNSGSDYKALIIRAIENGPIPKVTLIAEAVAMLKVSKDTAAKGIKRAIRALVEAGAVTERPGGMVGM